MKQVKKISIIFLFLTIFACEQKSEVELETLAKTYIDLLVIEDFYRDSDSLEIKKQEVFEKYSLTKDIYDSTFAKFEHNNELWEKFFKYSSDYLDTLKSNIKHPEKPKGKPSRS